MKIFFAFFDYKVVQKLDHYMQNMHVYKQKCSQKLCNSIALITFLGKTIPSGQFNPKDG